MIKYRIFEYLLRAQAMVLILLWSDIDKKKVNGHIKQLQKNCKKIDEGLKRVA